MASNAKTLGAVRRAPTVASRGAAKGEPGFATLPAGLSAHVTVLRTRRGQTLTLASAGDLAFIVRSGVLMLHVTLPDSARQGVALLFPGDLIQSGFAPPHAKATLVAASAGEVWRMSFAAVETLAAGDPAVMRYLSDAVASWIARQAIHAATLGQLDCEQRVATLLVELALRTGAGSPQGFVFDLPFSRKDIASYLGLNPDTLSRIMSRFRAAPFFGHIDRNRVVVRDFAALAALSPAAQSLMAMSGAQSPLLGANG